MRRARFAPGPPFFVSRGWVLRGKQEKFLGLFVKSCTETYTL